MPSTLLTLYVAGHLIQYLLRVLKSLHQLSILALHYISQSVLAFLFVFVCVQQLFGDGVYKKFALVNEDDLNWLVVESEDNRMFRAEPSPDID